MSTQQVSAIITVSQIMGLSLGLFAILCAMFPVV